MSVAATRKNSSKGNLETKAKRITIEDALDLLDIDKLKPKSFGQDLEDLRTGLEILDRIITEMRKIDERNQSRLVYVKLPNYTKVSQPYKLNK